MAERLHPPSTPAPGSFTRGLLDEEEKEHEEKVVQTPRSAPWSTNDRGLAQLVKKLEPPPVYTGDTQKDKITDLRQWVVRADDYMDIHMGEGGTDLATFDHVLGDEYGKIIERSDLNLWRDVYRGGIPQTLSEWKTRTAAAWGARQIVNQRTSGGRPTFGRGYRANVGEREALPVNELQATEDDDKDDLQETGRADPSSTVEVQQASAGSRAPRSGVQLSEDMRKQLMAKGMCFSCYKRGHRARDVNECPNKGKRATRLPTKEELNA